MDDELIQKQLVYTGKKMKLEVHHLRQPDGTRYVKEVVVHPGAVVIIPILDDGRLVMIRNYRYTVDKWLLEVPAGTLEKGEPPIDCAGRELLEETGYLAGKLASMGNFYASPGIMTELMHVFIATELTLQSAQLDQGEQIEVAPMTLSEAVHCIRTGEIVDSKTIAALLTYERFFHKV